MNQSYWKEEGIVASNNGLDVRGIEQVRQMDREL